jgi:hypothetical protein
MFEIYRKLNRKADEVAVFRNITAAETWLLETSSGDAPGRTRGRDSVQ